MNRFATSFPLLLAIALLFTVSTATGQSFEDEELGNWRGITNADQDYSTTVEISDSIASEGSYSVRVTTNGDELKGILANDEVELSGGDVIEMQVWVDEAQLNQIDGVQPMAQDGDWGWSSTWHGPGDLTAGEWNTVSHTVPDGFETTNRIGIQIDGLSDEDSPTIYLDEIAVNGAILPVELTAFDAVQDGNDVTLQWQTASETNNAGFEIEQRRGGNSWSEVGFVEGQGTGQGQSYSYSLTDLSPGQYTFRLRQVDYDGSSMLSSEVHVSVGVEDGLHLTQPAPNPVEDQTRFTLSVSERQEVRVEVFNVLGQQVAQLHDGPLSAGAVKSLTLESTDLPSGVYFVRGQTPSQTVTHRITLVK